MWALGCIFFMMLDGKHPIIDFDRMTREQGIQALIECKPRSFPGWVSDELKMLVTNLLSKEPNARMTAYDVQIYLRMINEPDPTSTATTRIRALIDDRART